LAATPTSSQASSAPTAAPAPGPPGTLARIPARAGVNGSAGRIASNRAGHAAVIEPAEACTPRTTEPNRPTTPDQATNARLNATKASPASRVNPTRPNGCGSHNSGRTLSMVASTTAWIAAITSPGSRPSTAIRGEDFIEVSTRELTACTTR